MPVPLPTPTHCDVHDPGSHIATAVSDCIAILREFALRFFPTPLREGVGGRPQSSCLAGGGLGLVLPERTISENSEIVCLAAAQGDHRRATGYSSHGGLAKLKG